MSSCNLNKLQLKYEAKKPKDEILEDIWWAWEFKRRNDFLKKDYQLWKKKNKELFDDLYKKGMDKNRPIGVHGSNGNYKAFHRDGKNPRISVVVNGRLMEDIRKMMDESQKKYGFQAHSDPSKRLTEEECKENAFGIMLVRPKADASLFRIDDIEDKIIKRKGNRDEFLLNDRYLFIRVDTWLRNDLILNEVERILKIFPKIFRKHNKKFWKYLAAYDSWKNKASWKQVAYVIEDEKEFIENRKTVIERVKGYRRHAYRLIYGVKAPKKKDLPKKELKRCDRCKERATCTEPCAEVQESANEGWVETQRELQVESLENIKLSDARKRFWQKTT